ncbi:MAG TPA: ROK family transcriptional regulator [Anaerolineales bacterium]|nr:ROK family transcriptional regulator [Anaerolineales bacterium]
MTTSHATSTKKKISRVTAPILVTSAEVEVMRALRRQGRISRSEISHITGWSKAKASQEIRILVDKGYLVEVGEGASQGGRKPRLLRINNQLGYVAGIDIGATSMDIALADVTGSILQHCSEATDVKLSPEAVFGRCSELLLELVRAQRAAPNQILGIGIGVPGPVDFARGVLVAPPLMPEWEDFPIRDFFKKTFNSAFVVVDNDVNIMALGEQRAGDGAGIDHFIFMKIGTGIGAGIISNGKIHRGSDGCAGDIGHICVDKEGPLCSCGNKGCLEAMAAGPAISTKAMEAARNGASPILSQMQEANGGVIRPEDVNAACREGDQASLDIIRDSGQMIGDVLASLVNFFNPSHIFVGGGITNFGNHLLVAIRRAVLHRSLPLATTHLSIKFSRMGSNAGVMGAISLALDYLFTIEDNPHSIF